jgi:hypothetical protein
MFKKFIALFKQTGYGNELEAYIVSRNPTNAAEIDQYTREFEQRKSYIWARGL